MGVGGWGLELGFGGWELGVGGWGWKIRVRPGACFCHLCVNRPAAAERSEQLFRKVVCLKKGPTQGQNLALPVSGVPNALDSGQAGLCDGAIQGHT